MAQKSEATAVTSGPVVVLGMSVGRPSSGRFRDSVVYKSVFQHVHWQHLAAGVSGGVVATLVLHPLDLVKVRFQGRYLGQAITLVVIMAKVLCCFNTAQFQFSWMK